MVPLFNINSKFQFISRFNPSDFLKQKIKGLPIALGNALWKELPSYLEESVIPRAVNSRIYTEVKRRTGALGKSLTPYYYRINQYSMDIGAFFDHKKAPHVSNHVFSFLERIHPRTKKWLTIPYEGSIADKYPRISVTSFSDVKFKKLNENLAVWYTGNWDRKNRQFSGILYWGKKSVKTSRRIYPASVDWFITSALEKRAIRIRDSIIEDFVGDK